MKYHTNRQSSLGFVLGALTCLLAPSIISAQEHEDFDSYAANSQVVGQGGWEEWGPGAGALVSTAQKLSLGNSIDIKGASDLVHQYSGYTTGKWEYSAMQYIPKTMTGKTYFILLSKYAGSSSKWAVQVVFDPASGTAGEAIADAGGAKARTPLVYDQWVKIRVVIHLGADWTQVYYNGVLLDAASVPNHPTLGGGYSWTGGYNGTSNGPKSIAAVDLFANNASSAYYDEITLEPYPYWRDDFDTYAANSQVVKQGGWEEWGAGAGALVSTKQARGPKNSIDIVGATDLVHQYSGYTSGKWEYTAWQYIPKGLTAKSYFILLSSYGTTNKWAVQVGFDPASGTAGEVVADAGGSGTAGQATTPIIYDKWVEIKVYIDLDADWVQFYYNGILLDSAAVTNHPTLGGGWTWTFGPFGSPTYAGLKAIGAVDLFANNASSVYYDDMVLRPARKGVRIYGQPTKGGTVYPRVYTNSAAVAPNPLFILGCRGPASKPGLFALTLDSFPSGIPLLGVSLLVDPSRLLIIAPTLTNAAGGSTFAAALSVGDKGAKVYVQYLWDDPTAATLSASDAMEILVQ